jgi:hypothetical protein
LPKSYHATEGCMQSGVLHVCAMVPPGMRKTRGHGGRTGL